MLPLARATDAEASLFYDAEASLADLHLVHATMVLSGNA
jgi:hypothetical protein